MRLLRSRARRRRPMRRLLRQLAGPVPGRVSRGGLIECERCHARIVNPVQWHEHDDAHWWIRLRCGECGFVRDVVVTDGEARQFERELDRGVTEIAAVLRRLEHARMATEVEALALALRHDLIDPEDFGRRRGAD